MCGSESGNCLKELSSSSTCHQWLKYNPSSFKFHLKVGISSIFFVDKKNFAFNLDTSLTHFNIDFRHHKESSSIYIFLKKHKRLNKYWQNFFLSNPEEDATHFINPSSLLMQHLKSYLMCFWDKLFLKHGSKIENCRLKTIFFN